MFFCCCFFSLQRFNIFPFFIVTTSSAGDTVVPSMSLLVVHLNKTEIYIEKTSCFLAFVKHKLSSSSGMTHLSIVKCINAL